MRCRCTWASTCAAACISCCRSTCARRSTNASRPSVPTSARCCARRTSATPASASRATEIEIRFRDVETRARAEDLIRGQIRELTLREDGTGPDFLLFATLSPAAQKEIQDSALKQNITTLHNRVNELGVAEPVIQQQGADRIVVQLPGVQDVARAKSLLGRTATLEIRMVDQEAMASGGAGALTVPERKSDGTVTPVALKRDVVVTGNQLE